jgi:2-methylisocitrate lyase-like PEP mutase family enzyme
MLVNPDCGTIERLLVTHGLPAAGPLVLPGCWDAFSAGLIERAGHEAAFVGRAAVARAVLGNQPGVLASFGMMLSATSEIRDSTRLSLCVDIGGGFGNAFNLARTAINMRTAGAEAVQLSDGVALDEFNPLHRQTADMIGKLKALLDAAPEFIVIARTRRVRGEAVAALIDRCRAYGEAGAHLVALAGEISGRDLAAIVLAGGARVPFAIETDDLVAPGTPDGVLLVCQPLRFQLALEKLAAAQLQDDERDRQQQRHQAMPNP